MTNESPIGTDQCGCKIDANAPYPACPHDIRGPIGAAGPPGHGPIGESGPNDPNGGPVGQWPDLSSLSEEERHRVPAIHTLMPSEVGKVPVVDDIFYEGHVGFYEPEKVEEAKQKARVRREDRASFFSRCLVIATIGNRAPDILSIRQPHRKFRLEIIDHGDAHRPGLGAYNWKGHKWHNINRMFASGMIRVEDFDYFAFFDDDIIISTDDVHRLFLLGHQYGFRLFQASLSDKSSNIGWPSATKTVPGSIARMTNFVEIMAPVFSREALKICLPSFMENASGWGLDLVWPKLLGYEGIGVIDAVSMIHTGKTTSGNWVLENGKTPALEMRETLANHGISYDIACRNVQSFGPACCQC